MIFIVAKFETKPEWTDRWPELVAPFTAATRAEEGNLWFDWSRSLENPAEYVLVEAFRDGDAVLCLGDARLLARFQEPEAKVRDVVGICAIPGTKANRVPYLGGRGHLLAVPRSAAQGEAAVDLLTRNGRAWHEPVTTHANVPERGECALRQRDRPTIRCLARRGRSRTARSDRACAGSGSARS